MEENVFYIEETTSRPPGNGNNCNGHKNAIKAGGIGNVSPSKIKSLIQKHKQ